MGISKNARLGAALTAALMIIPAAFYASAQSGADIHSYYVITDLGNFFQIKPPPPPIDPQFDISPYLEQNKAKGIVGIVYPHPDQEKNKYYLRDMGNYIDIPDAGDYPTGRVVLINEKDWNSRSSVDLGALPSAPLAGSIRVSNNDIVYGLMENFDERRDLFSDTSWCDGTPDSQCINLSGSTIRFLNATVDSSRIKYVNVPADGTTIIQLKDVPVGINFVCPDCRAGQIYAYAGYQRHTTHGLWSDFGSISNNPLAVTDIGSVAPSTFPRPDLHPNLADVSTGAMRATDSIMALKIVEARNADNSCNLSSHNVTVTPNTGVSPPTFSVAFEDSTCNPVSQYRPYFIRSVASMLNYVPIYEGYNRVDITTPDARYGSSIPILIIHGPGGTTDLQVQIQKFTAIDDGILCCPGFRPILDIHGLGGKVMIIYSRDMHLMLLGNGARIEPYYDATLRMLQQIQLTGTPPVSDGPTYILHQDYNKSSPYNGLNWEPDGTSHTKPYRVKLVSGLSVEMTTHGGRGEIYDIRNDKLLGRHNHYPIAEQIFENAQVMMNAEKLYKTITEWESQGPNGDDDNHFTMRIILSYWNQLTKSNPLVPWYDTCDADEWKANYAKCEKQNNNINFLLMFNHIAGRDIMFGDNDGSSLALDVIAAGYSGTAWLNHHLTHIGLPANDIYLDVPLPRDTFTIQNIYVVIPFQQATAVRDVYLSKFPCGSGVDDKEFKRLGERLIADDDTKYLWNTINIIRTGVEVPDDVNKALIAALNVRAQTQLPYLEGSYEPGEKMNVPVLPNRQYLCFKQGAAQLTTTIDVTSLRFAGDGFSVGNIQYTDITTAPGGVHCSDVYLTNPNNLFHCSAAHNTWDTIYETSIMAPRDGQVGVDVLANIGMAISGLAIAKAPVGNTADQWRDGNVTGQFRALIEFEGGEYGLDLGEIVIDLDGAVAGSVPGDTGPFTYEETYPTHPYFVVEHDIGVVRNEDIQVTDYGTVATASLTMTMSHKNMWNTINTCFGSGGTTSIKLIVGGNEYDVTHNTCSNPSAEDTIDLTSVVAGAVIDSTNDKWILVFDDPNDNDVFTFDVRIKSIKIEYTIEDIAPTTQSIPPVVTTGKMDPKTGYEICAYRFNIDALGQSIFKSAGTSIPMKAGETLKIRLQFKANLDGTGDNTSMFTNPVPFCGVTKYVERLYTTINVGTFRVDVY